MTQVQKYEIFGNSLSVISNQKKQIFLIGWKRSVCCQ